MKELFTEPRMNKGISPARNFLLLVGYRTLLCLELELNTKCIIHPLTPLHCNLESEFTSLNNPSDFKSRAILKRR